MRQTLLHFPSDKINVDRRLQVIIWLILEILLSWKFFIEICWGNGHFLTEFEEILTYLCFNHKILSLLEDCWEPSYLSSLFGNKILEKNVNFRQEIYNPLEKSVEYMYYLFYLVPPQPRPQFCLPCYHWSTGQKLKGQNEAHIELMMTKESSLVLFKV